MPRARQPVRVAPNQPYGERKALERLQRSAPMAAAPSTAPAPETAPPQLPAQGPSGAAAPPVPPPPGQGRDAFGPTNRPGEPITTGIPQGPGASGPSWYLKQDAKSLLRVAYEAYPDPWILRLLQDEAAPDPFFKPLASKPRFSPPAPVLRPAE